MSRASLPVFGLLALALFSFACGESDEEKAQRAKRLVDNGAVLLDVRSADEYNTAHVRGALHIPVRELPQRLEEIPQGSRVVVYCESGVRSAQAMAVLQQRGHEVLDLGGLDDWPDRADIVQ